MFLDLSFSTSDSFKPLQIAGVFLWVDLWALGWSSMAEQKERHAIRVLIFPMALLQDANAESRRLRTSAWS